MKVLDPYGILVVDKDQGWTSHDVCALIRSRFHIEKVGHAGTLDPLATGVLILLLGRATKLSGELSSSDKEYSGTFELGIKTDSHDILGTVTEKLDWQHVTEEKLKEVFEKFQGVIEQTPPMVSALKHQGVRLYRLARAGKIVDREKRTVTIHEFRIEDIQLPKVRFFAHVSKGTYLRALVNDIGDLLGAGAVLTELRRVRSGIYGLDNSVRPEQLKRMSFEELKPLIKHPAQALVG
jgi:tRNA pseudouridine55 synthase